MSKSYRFGHFVLDPGRRTLSHADSSVSLTPKAFDVLLFLAQNPNRLVTKEELLQAVWGDTFVEEGNLAQYVWHHSTREAFLIAEIYAFRNRRDEAFEWLDRAYGQREGNLARTNFEPMLKNLHGDPRYNTFLNKIHLPT
jgi:hypothetical protein